MRLTAMLTALILTTATSDAFLLTHRTHNRLETVRAVAVQGGGLGVAVNLSTLPAYGRALGDDLMGTVWDTAIDVGSTALLGWVAYEGLEWADEMLNDDKEKDEYTVLKAAENPPSNNMEAEDDSANYNVYVIGDGANINVR